MQLSKDMAKEYRREELDFRASLEVFVTMFTIWISKKRTLDLKWHWMKLKAEKLEELLLDLG